MGRKCDQEGASQVGREQFMALEGSVWSKIRCRGRSQEAVGWRRSQSSFSVWSCEWVAEVAWQWRVARKENYTKRTLIPLAQTCRIHSELQENVLNKKLYLDV